MGRYRPQARHDRVVSEQKKDAVLRTQSRGTTIVQATPPDQPSNKVIYLIFQQTSYDGRPLF